MLTNEIIILGSYLFTGICITAGLIHLLGIRDRTEQFSYLILSCALAPSVISRLLTYSYFVFPAWPVKHYLLVVLVCVASLLLLGRKSVAAALSGIRPQFAIPQLTRFIASYVLFLFTCWIIWAYSEILFTKPAQYIMQGKFWSGSWWRTALSFYGVIILVLLIPLMVASSKFGLDKSEEQKKNKSLRKSRRTATFLLLVFLFAIAIKYVHLIIALPIHENDALMYFKIATAFFEYGTLAIYPLIPPLEDGTWAATSHPLGYHGTLLWNFLLAADSSPRYAKIAGAYHFITLLFVMLRLCWLASSNLFGSIFGTLIFVTTPVIYYQFVGLGIDSFRLCILVTMVFAFSIMLPDLSRPKALVLGLIVGLAMNSHSINGFIAPLTATLLILICCSATLKNKLLFLVFVATGAFLLGAERYIQNIVAYGTPVFDRHVLWDLVPELDYLAWRSHGVEYTSALARWISGALLGFNGWYLWGLGWWIGTAASIAYLIFYRCRDIMLISIIGWLTIFLFLSAFYLLYAGSSAYVLNYRYIMTAYPFICITAGIWLGKLMDD